MLNTSSSDLLQSKQAFLFTTSSAATRQLTRSTPLQQPNSCSIRQPVKASPKMWMPFWSSDRNTTMQGRQRSHMQKWPSNMQTPIRPISDPVVMASASEQSKVSAAMDAAAGNSLQQVGGDLGGSKGMRKISSHEMRVVMQPRKASAKFDAFEQPINIFGNKAEEDMKQVWKPNELMRIEALAATGQGTVPIVKNYEQDSEDEMVLIKNYYDAEMDVKNSQKAAQAANLSFLGESVGQVFAAALIALYAVFSSPNSVQAANLGEFDTDMPRTSHIGAGINTWGTCLTGNKIHILNPQQDQFQGLIFGQDMMADITNTQNDRSPFQYNSPQSYRKQDTSTNQAKYLGLSALGTSAIWAFWQSNPNLRKSMNPKKQF